jgi:hypothetical protein
LPFNGIFKDSERDRKAISSYTRILGARGRELTTWLLVLKLFVKFDPQKSSLPQPVRQGKFGLMILFLGFLPQTDAQPHLFKGVEIGGCIIVGSLATKEK